jgi:hypothetical protein
VERNVSINTVSISEFVLPEVNRTLPQIIEKISAGYNTFLTEDPSDKEYLRIKVSDAQFMDIGLFLLFKELMNSKAQVFIPEPSDE